MAPSIRKLFRRSTSKKDTQPLSIPQEGTEPTKHTTTTATTTTPADTPHQPPSRTKQASSEPELDLDEHREEPTDFEFHKHLKRAGALSFGRHGPYPHSAHVVAHVYWDGRKDDRTTAYWEDRRKGFVSAGHASFESYHRKKYIKRTKPTLETQYDAEYSTFFDIESDTKYENENPGTVTLEGFGLECWDYEERFGRTPRKNIIMINRCKMPNVPARKLLRRLSEFQGDCRPLGLDEELDDLDLQEFMGNLGIVYFDPKITRDPTRWFDHLYNLLNRTDIFVNFLSDSSVATTWGGAKDKSISIWNFLWQIIITTELARRLAFYDEATKYLGFNSGTLASLIVADLWVQNVKMVLVDAKVDTTSLKKILTAEEKSRAEEFKAQGNDAFQKGEFERALKLYAEAIEISPCNAVYLSNQSAALVKLGKFLNAADDAYMATRIDPKFAKAWARLGMAQLKLGHAKQVNESYEQAIKIAGSTATETMRQGLAEAKSTIEAEIKALNNEKNKARHAVLRNVYLDKEWEGVRKSYEMHSLVHGRQTEGLLFFAERLKWPYLNEARDRIENTNSRLRSGQELPFHLFDWIMGLALPGKWFSFKIMSALILCTPSLAQDLGTAFYFDSGLSLPGKSYWRVRTVLARVLGCLPGVSSISGWIGPCPPVEIDSAEQADAKKPRHIHLSARSVAPFVAGPSYSEEDQIPIHPSDDLKSYEAEICDLTKWTAPIAPEQRSITCTVKSIRLTKLPLEVSVATQLANQQITVSEAEKKAEFRAAISFQVHLGSSTQKVKYTLFANPVFVTPPPCHMGPHEVHLRELPRYKREVVTVDRLKEYEGVNNGAWDIIVINATGEGAEALARAWCAERGKNAVIRRAEGACYACALRAASKPGLGLGVLIWVF